MGGSVALFLIAGLLVLLWLGQRRLIYLPMGAVASPERLGPSRTEQIEIASADQVRLGAWFIPATDRPARATLIFFNGNAGNRSYRAPFASAVAPLGVNVLLFDYRGYGDSSGSPTEQGLLADAAAVRAYVASRPDVNPDRLVYVGESLGTGVAVALAIDSPPGLLVLRSPFSSLADVAARHYWFLPVRRLLWDRYDSRSRIGELRCPLVVIAGDRDRIVPADLSRRLFEAAREPKRFITVHGAGHNDPELTHGPEVVGAIADALAEFVPEVRR